jgi:HK97 gp10 family phage protein
MSVTYKTDIPEIIAGLEGKADMIVRKAAQDILTDSHQRVPVKTGHLKSTGNVQNIGPARAEIGYDADYAQFVEEGTRHQHAQPFLRPAFDRVVPLFLAALRKLV